MKAVKIACFFAAGALVQILLFTLLQVLLFYDVGVFVAFAVYTLFLELFLGFAARKIAGKMNTSPLPLVISYIAGTVAAIVALFVYLDVRYPLAPDNTGLGGLPNLDRIFMFFCLFAKIPAALLNAVVQTVLCVIGLRRKNAERRG